MRTIYYSCYLSPVGPLGLAAAEDEMCRLDLNVDPDLFRDKLECRYRGAISENPDRFVRVRAELDGYFAGAVRHFSVPVVFMEGTAFQRRVWQTLLTIPYGEVRSYAWVAGRIGSPKAFRAVGQANGRNPVSIIVPCHRVINSDGGLGGYGGGLEMKKTLLALEGYHGAGGKGNHGRF